MVDLFWEIKQCNLTGKVAYLRLFYLGYCPYIQSFREHETYEENKKEAIEFVGKLRAAELNYE